MNPDDQTIRLVVDDGDNSLYEISNCFGSKIITLDRLIELTPWPGEVASKEAGLAELTRNFNDEIARGN
jgi:hypothetical protein